MPEPRKRFGQHFLCDKNVIARIVNALHIKPTEHLVEIGPGQGALTTAVLQQTKQLDAIELDYDLIPALQDRAHRYGDLVIHQADALTFNFRQLKIDARMLRVFGNLPYNISTPLIFHLLNSADVIGDMLFMLQKEVAERLVAQANDEHYGRLSIMVQYRCQGEILFDIGPEAFYPPPKVQSSIVRLVPYRELPYPAQDFKLFTTVVREAFNLRRKTLRNSLKHIVPAIVWETVGIASDLRPETLSMQQFVLLSNAISMVKAQGQ
ncbi:MAG: 16S rRNA (adenine(1518)-N(6)/adenine(1519)-N(6))-dimethyltransferase RsmA [Gammaproteobacteria bacterium]|nr:16S rRNA (adenine(1518)-N(6)/adenine(1519)-N(6))-dimethyltransferase RsmA [Gammaproteobacteria bacterium]